MHRFFGMALMKDVLLVGRREMFGKYIAGMPEDSALMRKLRAPYEAQDEAKRKLKDDFAQMHG